GHVHFSENDRGTPGTGHVDWHGILSVLREVGYDGWVTIESFAQPEPELASAASIWRDLAPSGDELAVQGLTFIRCVAEKATRGPIVGPPRCKAASNSAVIRGGVAEVLKTARVSHA